MNTTMLLVFGIIGAICAFVITGGALSMSGEAPSSGQLASGAAAGAGLGAVLAQFLTNTENPVLDSIQEFVNTNTTSSETPEMKIGLPGF